MKLKKNNNILENKLLMETFKKFILKAIILAIAIPLISLLFAKLINIIEFQWLYDLSPEIYYNAKDFFYFLFSYESIFFVILITFIIGEAVLIYQLLRKVFYYFNEITLASKQLLDKDIDYIELSPELESISLQMNHLKTVAERNEQAAKDSEQKKNDLIVYLAHDLKTPLTSVIAYLELLKESPDLPIEQRTKYIGITLDKAYRLEELMNEFFEIARFNDINIVLMKKKVNLKLMLEQVIDEFFPMLNEQNKKILINCKQDIDCYIDSDKMARVFNNVIKNAINYSFEDTEIKIDVSLDNNETITVSIKNEGYTIPENKLSSIFEKFYRLDDSRNTNNGGAGLGLAIAKEIITLHSGSIVADSKDNITTFTLKFPQNQK